MTLRIFGEVDALSSSFDSFDAVLARIESNRIARLNVTGTEYITGEEADWLLTQMVPRDKAYRAERAAICNWLRANGGEHFVEDLEMGAHEE